MIEIDDSQLQSSNDSINLKFFDKYDTEISYQFFFQNHLLANKPCIFGSWLTKNWPVTKLWVDDDGTPNCAYLSESFGDNLVPVSNCDSKYFNSQAKETHSLRDYMNYYCQKQKGLKEESLYLKDWHFVRDCPNYNAYIIPIYFGSDWLNEFWSLRDGQVDDYRFVYIGPKGSWTPFHADVFRSFSWSSNICGRKRWLFFPPSESDYLKDKFGEYVYDVESPSLKDVSQYPKAHLSKGPIEVIQERGETVFVPSNWYHQVWNLEDAISINHNWINGTNIEFVMDFMISSLKEVEESIEEFSQTEGWVAQCQLILKSVAGMDAEELYKFLKIIALRRMNYMKGDLSISSYSEWKMGRNHIIYDIKKLIRCFERFFGEFSPEIIDMVEENQKENLYHVMENLQTFL